jgi:hypothetical protein
MRMLKLFVLSCGLAGLLAMLGSMVGIAAGSIYAGGVIGGLVGCAAAAHSASRRGWIAPGRFLPTAVGAGAGFLAAAALAVTNLHTPVIPVLSTALVGIGALLGSRVPFPSRSAAPHT